MRPLVLPVVVMLAPACKDETVRYVFTGPIGGTNTSHLAADKLVGKEYLPMGETVAVRHAR